MRHRYRRLPRPSTWRAIAGDTFKACITDRVALAAAGCAFWTTIALFPAIAGLISIYGLVLDPRTAATHMDMLSDFLPPIAADLIGQRVRELADQQHRHLSFQLAGSTALALWSAATGTKSAMSALNIAFGVEEKRSTLRLQATGVLLTLLGTFAGVVTIATVVLLPAALSAATALGFDIPSKATIHGLSLVPVVGLFMAGTALLYSFGPSRPHNAHSRVVPGTIAATVIWLSASSALTFYISHLGRFSATYGPLGAVIGLMLWFYVSAYSALLGAELNARMEAEPE